jgi:hypothetical protein
VTVATIAVALVHHPVRDRAGRTITTSITNLDVHDIARAARSYGVSRYFIVTPIDAQRDLVAHILSYWREGDGGRRVPERAEALSLVEAVPALEDAIRALGERPLVVTTAARATGPSASFEALRARIASVAPRSVLLVFGTGYGLADELIASADVHLEPIRGRSEYNHLAVRTAVAIVLDRLLGED